MELSVSTTNFTSGISYLFWELYSAYKRWSGCANKRRSHVSGDVDVDIDVEIDLAPHVRSSENS